MAKERRRDYCTKCRKFTDYELTKTAVSEILGGKEYTFFYTAAICRECRETMNPPGMTDQNIQERDEQFRRTEGLISLEDIRRLTDSSPADIHTLSCALGFKKHDLEHYIRGQIPPASHSDAMKRMLQNTPNIHSGKKEN